MDHPFWRPLTIDQMPPEVRQQWEAQSPDGSIIRDWVIAQIEIQLDLNFNPDQWTVEQSSLLQGWLGFQLEQGDFFIRKYPRLQNLLHGTLTGKVWTLGQRHCIVCSGSKPIDEQLPVYLMPVRIAPESRQTLNSINWNAFQAAIKARFPSENYDFSGFDRLCIAFTFGLRNDRKDRDLDNMAKALQDAFSRALGFSDSHVHHLDIIKIIGDFKEEYVIIRVRPSHLNDHSDTLTKGVDLNWAGQPLLRITDFQDKD